MSQSDDAEATARAVLDAIVSLNKVVNEKVSTLSGGLDKIMSGINQLSGNVDTFHTDMIAKISQLTDAHSRLTEAHNELTEAHNELRTSVFSKLDRMQGTIELVKEDINVNFASSYTAVSNARSGREETENLAQIVYAMQRQYKLLAAQLEELRKDRLDGQRPDEKR